MVRGDLKDHGVPVDDGPNRRIREVEKPVKEFAEKHLNSVPSTEEVAVVLPALHALHGTLKNAGQDGAHPAQRKYGWGHLAAACVRIARMEDCSCAEPTGEFVAQVLLEAAEDPNPAANPKEDIQLKTLPLGGAHPPGLRRLKA